MQLHYLMHTPLFFTFIEMMEKKDMKIITNLNPTDYYLKDIVRIVNPRQQLLYIKNQVYPIDIYASVDDKTGNNIIVMIFLKTDTTDVYKKWCNYELE